MGETKLILASGSPRRIQIMREHGIEPEVFRPEVDESLPEKIGMEQAVMYLALKKALYAETAYDQGVIIAADTVVFRDRIIGKPADEEDAFSILRDLRGREHFVATGVAMLGAHTSDRKIFCEVTKVFFKEYGDEEIAAYIATGEYRDKAGGYAIQGGFAPYIDHIEGDYDNVVGFPWTRIRRELSAMNTDL